jgi:hypothetical protein
MKLKAVVFLLIAAAFALIVCWSDIVQAQDKKGPQEVVFEAGKKYHLFGVAYDIYYEVSGFEVDLLESVSVLGTVEIGGAKFLAVQGKNRLNNKPVDGFIRMNEVRAILPHFGGKPQRVLNIPSKQGKGNAGN